jgi:hypothetical protein
LLNSFFQKVLRAQMALGERFERGSFKEHTVVQPLVGVSLK